MTTEDGISIVYPTYRREPRFEWFADSLALQVDNDDVEVIFVDSHHGPERSAQLAEIVRDRFPYRHVPPKPTPYNGPYRLTQRDCFAAASARNTGIVYASKPYVAFVDDTSVLMPGWWQSMRRAAAEGIVVAGAFQRHVEMVVSNGELVSSRVNPDGLDSRRLPGDRRVRIPGGQLYSMNSGAPRSLLVEVNGFDELCDPIGGEDWQLGERLEHAGVWVYYTPEMLVVESDDLQNAGEHYVRVDKEADPRDYMDKLAEFGVTQRSVRGRWDSSHMLMDITRGTKSAQPMGNYYLLADLDAAGLADVVGRFPSRHWFDDQPLSEL